MNAFRSWIALTTMTGCANVIGVGELSSDSTPAIEVIGGTAGSTGSLNTLVPLSNTGGISSLDTTHRGTSDSVVGGTSAQGGIGGNSGSSVAGDGGTDGGSTGRVGSGGSAHGGTSQWTSDVSIAGAGSFGGRNTLSGGVAGQGEVAGHAGANHELEPGGRAGAGGVSTGSFAAIAGSAAAASNGGMSAQFGGSGHAGGSATVSNAGTAPKVTEYRLSDVLMTARGDLSNTPWSVFSALRQPQDRSQPLTSLIQLAPGQMYAETNVQWCYGGTNLDFGAVCINPNDSDSLGDSADVPGHTAFMHPGGTGRYIGVRWTSPLSGKVQIDALFLAADNGSTDVHLLVRSAPQVSFDLDGRGASVRTVTPVSIAQGDAIDFALAYGDDNSHNGDTTVMSLTMTLTTE